MKGNTVSMSLEALKNRLLKNQKKLKSFLQKNNIEAYRLYNKDIPEYPYIIDIFGDHAVIYEQGKKLTPEEVSIRKSHQDDIEKVLNKALNISRGYQHFKIREIQKGKDQYKTYDQDSENFFPVQEPPFKFLVNLERYLDTGLFLDHRPLRQHLFKISKDKNILNLFCYTGSLSVAAAKGGGKVTSIDMSNTYLQWAYENFLLNQIDPKEHTFYQADILKELGKRKENNQIYDIILLDPPSFSNSKRMDEVLDIERDHPILVRDCMNLLAKEGILYFSTNKRKFKLHDIILDHYVVKEISQWSIPQDFHQSHIHQAFEIRHKN